MLAMRLRDSSRSAAERTAAAVGDQLRSVKGFSGFADYPEIRSAGDYPGKQVFGQVTSIMTLVTILALLSALVLLSNTMTTLIGEQTQEIAAMKAIGATRRQIRRIYRRTALLLGACGAVLGAGLGIVLANPSSRSSARASTASRRGSTSTRRCSRSACGGGDRACARGDARDPPCIAPLASRSAERDGFCGRRPERAGPRPAPHPLPAPQRPDRVARRSEAQAPHARDRGTGRARGRHLLGRLSLAKAGRRT